MTRPKQDPVLKRLRAVCLRLPEATETVKWGHPTFEVGRKIFAVLDHYHGKECIAFRVRPFRQFALVEDPRFFPAPYGAKHGWVCIDTGGRIAWRRLEGLLRDSYRLAAEPKRKRRAEKASGSSRP